MGQVALALKNSSDYYSLKSHADIMEIRATIDGLTGLNNRASFDNILSVRMTESFENESNLSLILFDIDHFKKINDTYGRQFGDLVLKEVAAIAKGSFRKYDFISRYGGVEIVVILEADSNGAYIAAEQFR